MSVIHHYPIPAGERDFFLAIPKGSRYLKAVVKDGEPRIYFLVPDPDAELGDVMFYVVPTGAELTELEERALFLETLQVSEAGVTLVFHLFLEKTNV